MTPMLRVHLLSASREYRSDATLTVLRAVLAERGIDCTVSEGEERGTTLPGLDALDGADVLLVFCKRMTLAPQQLARIQAWCQDGKPVVGIRTASHAFQNWLEFDAEILGGSYDGHGPAEAAVRTEVEAPGHPIVGDLVGWTAPAKVYRNPTLAADATVLLSATGAGGRQPVAWCRRHPGTGGRVFYTSLGAIADFADGRLVDLLHRAVLWTAGRLPETAPDAARYWVAQLDALDAVTCPCGFSRRAFVRPDNPLATLHMVDITTDSRVHYHKRLTELYLILDGDGHMELDGRRVPVKPLTAIFIKPGCRHRAVGKLRIVNMPIPAFDPHDEWFDADGEDG